MSNTFTKLTDNTKGVYRHAETGFTVHEVYSVGDVIKANGALACDMTTGDWCWVAGEDLFVEVYRRMGNSLSKLAQLLLGTVYGIKHARFSIGTWYNGVGTWDVGCMSMPGMTRATRTYGSDIRLFGIATNAQAGRGCSVGLIDDLIGNDHPDAAGCTVSADLRGMAKTPSSPSSIPGLGGSAIAYGKSANIIGRAVIAIPLKSWTSFLSNWRNNLPNIDKGEVQERADAAIAKFETAFVNALYSVPSVRVPIVLTSDGCAYLDSNPTRSHNKPTNGSYGLYQYWDALYAPTLPEPGGWWTTNPLCAAPGVTHKHLGECVSGLNGNFYNTSGIDSNKVYANHVTAYSKLTDVDGIDLFKILGGLYPRVDEVRASSTSAALITKCFSGNHSDLPPPTQGGAETSVDYETRLQSMSNDAYSFLTGNFGHWNLAGQVAVLASTLLDASLVGRPINGVAALTLVSGTLCSLLRVGKGTTFTLWSGADITATPETYLRHQYAG